MTTTMFTYELALPLFDMIKNKNDIKCLILKKNLINIFVNQPVPPARYFDDHWKRRMLQIACVIGDLPLLKYLIINDDKFVWNKYENYDIIAWAARFGHLHIMKYAHKNGCTWHSYVTTIAVENKHLVCLKYALENGCLLHRDAIYTAVINKQLDFVKYFYEKQYQFDIRIIKAAISAGSWEILRYLYSSGHSLYKSDLKPFELNILSSKIPGFYY